MRVLAAILLGVMAGLAFSGWASELRIEATHPVLITGAGTQGHLLVSCSAEAPAGIRRRDPVLNAEQIGIHTPLHCWPASATAAALDGGAP